MHWISLFRRFYCFWIFIWYFSSSALSHFPKLLLVFCFILFHSSSVLICLVIIYQKNKYWNCVSNEIFWCNLIFDACFPINNQKCKIIQTKNCYCIVLFIFIQARKQYIVYKYIRFKRRNEAKNQNKDRFFVLF